MGFYWFEEPIPSGQIDGYARLNEALEIPVTGGESLWTVEQIEPYLEKKACVIVQVDAGVSGMSECVKVTRRAADFGVELADDLEERFPFVEGSWADSVTR